MQFRDIDINILDEIVDLSVSPAQEALIADNCYSVAQVALTEGAWCRGIYIDNTPVGFFSIIECSTDHVYLWRFMIAAAHQGKGYGRRAIAALVETFAERGFKTFDLTVRRDTGGAEPFYFKCGFRPTDECVNAQWRMVMDLADPAPSTRPS